MLELCKHALAQKAFLFCLFYFLYMLTFTLSTSAAARRHLFALVKSPTHVVTCCHCPCVIWLFWVSAYQSCWEGGAEEAAGPAAGFGALNRASVATPPMHPAMSVVEKEKEKAGALVVYLDYFPEPFVKEYFGDDGSEQIPDDCRGQL